MSAHKQADELTQEEGSTAYTHTRLIENNESSAALINFPVPAVSCTGPTVGLST